MKHLIIAVCMLIATTGFAQQTEKFVQAMNTALEQLGQAKTGEDMVAVAQKFERIGDAEKTEWLPYYYAAMVKARMSMAGFGGDKDVVADEANTLIEKADALQKNNSEILCVKSLIATAKMLVNPQARYMEYGMKSGMFLEEAKKADPTNPRPYMLQAISLKNTPEQFGGGCKQAKPLADKALTLYAAFKPVSTIYPNWGKETVQEVADACK
jgi:hypothetical protein